MTGAANAAALTASQQAASANPKGGGFNLFGADGFTFKDLLDVINPLQQLPIVGTIYRHLTGDHISPFSRVLGGFLIGGPIGAAASAVNAVVEQASGKDVGEQVLAAFQGNSAADSVAGQVAAAASPTAAGETAVAQTVRPGGWIINAAYGNRGSAVAAQVVALQDAVESPSASPVPTAPRPRPGGWMINAAYGNFGPVGRQLAGAAAAAQPIDVSA